MKTQTTLILLILLASCVQYNASPQAEIQGIEIQAYVIDDVGSQERYRFANADVTITPETSGEVIETQTNNLGEAVIQLEAGFYTVCVEGQCTEMRILEERTTQMRFTHPFLGVECSPQVCS